MKCHFVPRFNSHSWNKYITLHRRAALALAGDPVPCTAERIHVYIDGDSQGS